MIGLSHEIFCTVVHCNEKIHSNQTRVVQNF